MKQTKLLKTSFTNGAVAILACTICTYIVLDNFAKPASPKSNFATFVFSICIGGSIALAFISSFHRGVFLKKYNPFSTNMIGEIILVQSVLTFSFEGGLLKTNVFAISSMFLQSMCTYYYFKNAVKGLNLNENFYRNIPTIAALTVLGFAFLLTPLQNFYGLGELALTFFVIQTSVCILGLLSSLLWYSISPKYQLDRSNKWNSIKLRIQNHHSKPSTFTTSLLSSTLQLFAIALLAVYLRTEFNHYSLTYVTLCTFAFLPLMLELWYELDHIASDQETLTSYSKLTTQSARTLLSRHKQESNVWAATVGIKTSTFTVDHDPDAFISKKIPATLLRIRGEEIYNFINQITKHQSLYSKTISQKVIGTIDPEHSIRPCVDVLNLCATLYLDAGTLLERRLSGLVSLLPIVNPGLANAINQETLLPLLKKAEWFFHFDFSWVDQSIFHTPSSARYGIHQDPVGEDAKLAMMEFMRKSYGIGNFVWVGKDAHERILQEAPNLANIMEHHNIQTLSGQHIQVFSLKFEHLIPRLQRYYGLDAIRAKIIDFDPSSEAQRLLSILDLQIKSHKGEKDLNRIAESISSYNWKGFKEKDQALKLLLKISQTVDSNDPKNQTLIKNLKEGIKKVGYPSQLMNQAQIYKLAQRDISKLQANALDPYSPQFEESWVMMASLDYKRYNDAELNTLRKIILSATKNNKIFNKDIAQARMIDSTVALIKNKTDQYPEEDIKLLLAVVSAMIQCKAKPESMTLAIDAFTFVSQYTGAPITLTKQIIDYFEASEHKADKSEHSIWSLSMNSRWQEYKSTFISTNNLKAS